MVNVYYRAMPYFLDFSLFYGLLYISEGLALHFDRRMGKYKHL